MDGGALIPRKPVADIVSHRNTALSLFPRRPAAARPRIVDGPCPTTDRHRRLGPCR